MIDLQVSVSCDNALLPGVDRSIADSPFDIIVGNPPYMRVKSMFAGSGDRKQKKERFAKAVKDSGLYTCQVNIVDDVGGTFAFPRVALYVRK
jgi:methylase of polypeptide subunit release factors